MNSQDMEIQEILDAMADAGDEIPTAAAVTELAPEPETSTEEDATHSRDTAPQSWKNFDIEQETGSGTVGEQSSSAFSDSSDESPMQSPRKSTANDEESELWSDGDDAPPPRPTNPLAPSEVEERLAAQRQPQPSEDELRQDVFDRQTTINEHKYGPPTAHGQRPLRPYSGRKDGKMDPLGDIVRNATHSRRKPFVAQPMPDYRTKKATGWTPGKSSMSKESLPPSPEQSHRIATEPEDEPVVSDNDQSAVQPSPELPSASSSDYGDEEGEADPMTQDIFDQGASGLSDDVDLLTTSDRIDPQAGDDGLLDEETSGTLVGESGQEPEEGTKEGDQNGVSHDDGNAFILDDTPEYYVDGAPLEQPPNEAVSRPKETGDGERPSTSEPQQQPIAPDSPIAGLYETANITDYLYEDEEEFDHLTGLRIDSSGTNPWPENAGRVCEEDKRQPSDSPPTPKSADLLEQVTGMSMYKFNRLSELARTGAMAHPQRALEMKRQMLQALHGLEDARVRRLGDEVARLKHRAQESWVSAAAHLYRCERERYRADRDWYRADRDRFSVLSSEWEAWGKNEKLVNGELQQELQQEKKSLRRFEGLEQELEQERKRSREFEGLEQELEQERARRQRLEKIYKKVAPLWDLQQKREKEGCSPIAGTQTDISFQDPRAGPARHDTRASDRPEWPRLPFELDAGIRAGLLPEIARWINEFHAEQRGDARSNVTVERLETLLDFGGTYDDFVSTIESDGLLFRPDHLAVFVERYADERRASVPLAVLQAIYQPDPTVDEQGLTRVFDELAQRQTDRNLLQEQLRLELSLDSTYERMNAHGRIGTPADLSIRLGEVGVTNNKLRRQRQRLQAEREELQAGNDAMRQALDDLLATPPRSARSSLDTPASLTVEEESKVDALQFKLDQCREQSQQLQQALDGSDSAKQGLGRQLEECRQEMAATSRRFETQVAELKQTAESSTGELQRLQAQNSHLTAHNTELEVKQNGRAAAADAAGTHELTTLRAALQRLKTDTTRLTAENKRYNVLLNDSALLLDQARQASARITTDLPGPDPNAPGTPPSAAFTLPLPHPDAPSPPPDALVDADMTKPHWLAREERMMRTPRFPAMQAVLVERLRRRDAEREARWEEEFARGVGEREGERERARARTGMGMGMGVEVVG